MSVATEFAPVVYIPARALPSEQPTARVLELVRPSAESIAAPLRLTRRGVVALAIAVAVVAVSLVWLAWLSAPSAPAVARMPDSVTVGGGDTLWSIATRIAPTRDPRAEVAELQRINHLTTPDLTAGQILRTH